MDLMAIIAIIALAIPLYSVVFGIMIWILCDKLDWTNRHNQATEGAIAAAALWPIFLLFVLPGLASYHAVSRITTRRKIPKAEVINE